MAVLAGALLAACGSEAPIAEETALAAPVVVEEDIVLDGPERRILAFGDSLFAGYNLAENQGYPEQLERALRSEGVNVRVIDAAVSGDTTQAGLQRLSFVLDNLSEPIDLAMVELGGNDLLRGLSAEAAKDNLTAIMEEFAARDIPVLIMGMRAPPNAGPEYQAEFDGMYPALAEQYGAALVPFFLEPVFGNPDLNLPDRIHPTAEGISLIVEATTDDVVEALREASR